MRCDRSNHILTVYTDLCFQSTVHILKGISWSKVNVSPKLIMEDNVINEKTSSYTVFPALSIVCCIRFAQNKAILVHIHDAGVTPIPNSHYSDVTMGPVASEITSLTIVYSTVYSGSDHRKHQSSVPLAIVRGNHRWPVNSSHKWPVTWKMFPFDDVIMRRAAWYCHTLSKSFYCT